jgi:hypothetical protein
VRPAEIAVLLLTVIAVLVEFWWMDAARTQETPIRNVLRRLLRL